MGIITNYFNRSSWVFLSLKILYLAELNKVNYIPKIAPLAYNVIEMAKL